MPELFQRQVSLSWWLPLHRYISMLVYLAGSWSPGPGQRFPDSLHLSDSVFCHPVVGILSDGPFLLVCVCVCVSAPPVRLVRGWPGHFLSFSTHCVLCPDPLIRGCGQHSRRSPLCPHSRMPFPLLPTSASAVLELPAAITFVSLKENCYIYRVPEHPMKLIAPLQPMPDGCGGIRMPASMPPDGDK